MICLGCGRTIVPGTTQCLYCGYAADRYALGALPSNSSGGSDVHVDVRTAPSACEALPHGLVEEGTAERLRMKKLVIGEDDFAEIPVCSHSHNGERPRTRSRHGIGARSRQFFLFFAFLGSAGVFGLVAWLMA
jgi:hypothetical protein